MSFFIKSNFKHNSSFKKGQNRKRKQTRREDTRNEEISSSDDEINETIPDKSSSEDENETAQEKKIRLAKVYLQEIKNAENRRLENEQLDEACRGNVIQRRLQEDYLKNAGKLRLRVGKKYTGFISENIITLKCKEHQKSITAICISNDNRFVFSGSKDGCLVKWSLHDGKKLLSLPGTKNKDSNAKGHWKTIHSIAISTDSNYLVVADESPNIQVWNPLNLQHLKTLEGHRDAVTGLVFRRDTHTLYSSGKDHCVKVWTLDEMAYVETLYGHTDTITGIDAWMKERAITSGGKDKSLRLWKIADESQLIFNAENGSIDCVKIINEETFVTGGDNGELSIWSISRKKPMCVVKNAHGLNKMNNEANWIISVASLVNTDLLASGSNDGFIKIWSLSENCKELEKQFEIPIEGFINSLYFTSDGKYLIAGIGTEHRFGRWDVIKSAKNSVLIIPLISSSIPR